MSTEDRSFDPVAIAGIAAKPAMIAPVGLQRLFVWKKDVAYMLGISLRTLERMISSGEVPPPNRRLRGRPAWLAKTIEEWANGDTVSAHGESA